MGLTKGPIGDGALGEFLTGRRRALRGRGRLSLSLSLPLSSVISFPASAGSGRDSLSERRLLVCCPIS
jgi:hypothetical protein